MTEDPLERIEREERERKEKKGPRTLMTILAVIALVLAGILGYMLYQRNALVKDLESEKAELAQQMVALQEDFNTLNSDYENINHQLDTSREQVALLIEKLSKTEATNRAKIRQYEKELGTLRAIMKGYIVQIDSLNTLNKKLTADAAEARREAAESRRANEQLTAQVENLSSQVNAGKILKARAISLVGYMSNDKPGDRHSRVRYMVANLSLVENSLADRGPVRVYVRVKDPEGLLLINNESTEFMVNGEVLQATASREVDYEGNEVDLSIYINDTGTFNKGVYTLEVYTEKGLLGHAECMLR
jgi:archaellum component FlaG (FlaF/FlaG flagellin family)